jgi:sarcosine oxidase
VWDPAAGICYPERTVRAQVRAAQQLGADLYPHTMVTAVEAGPDFVGVRTATVEFRARQVVVAAGGWLGPLVGGLPLAPRRVPLSWFRPAGPGLEDFTLGRFPAFIWHRADGPNLWGHGSDEDYAIKIGIGNAGNLSSGTGIEAEQLDRYIHLDRDVDELAAVIARAFPGLDPRPASIIPCLVTHSPDGQFLLGRLPSQPRVIVAGGDSGHGFKHAAGLGELLAQIVTGEDPYCDVTFLDPVRFS